jgi:hypothetical protein
LALARNDFGTGPFGILFPQFEGLEARANSGTAWRLAMFRLSSRMATDYELQKYDNFTRYGHVVVVDPLGARPYRMRQWTSVLRQTCRIATCHGFQRPFYRAHSALRGAAAGTVERPYHHSVVFDKSGKHRANKLAAPVVFRDGHPVPMQKISLPTSTKV